MHVLKNVQNQLENLFKIVCIKYTPLLKGLTMIFAGQENPCIIMELYFKTNNKIPINLLK